MRSFAVLAGLAASANAYAYGYPAYNASSSAVVSTPAGYVASSSAAGYAASTPVAVYSTKVVTGLSTVCATPTTLSVGSKTYIVKTSTTIIDKDCEYTTTYAVSTPAPVKPTSAVPVVPASSAVVVPYPSKNGTAPTYPAGTAAPSATKSAPPTQFTGAAAQKGAAVLAVVGAMAAFL